MHAVTFAVLAFGAASGAAFGVPFVEMTASAQTAAPGLPELTVERLPNGIRVGTLAIDRGSPPSDVDLTFGYVPGLQDPDLAGARVAAAFAAYLDRSVPARAVGLAAHLAGGDFRIVSAQDRVGMRVSVPEDRVGVTVEQIGRYFSHAIINFEILEYVHDEMRAGRIAVPEQPDDVTVEVQAALFDTLPSFEETSGELPGLGEVQEYLDTYVGTDRAFLIASRPLDDEVLATLGRVRLRPSRYEIDVREMGTASEPIELRYPSQPSGGVVIATGVPDPRYESWFGALMVARVLARTAADDVRIEFALEPGPSMHRIDAPVTLPTYSEDVRDAWLERIRRMAVEPLPQAELDQIRSDVLAWLSEPATLDWFVAHDLWDALEVGWDLVSFLTPDELRSQAIVFGASRRVVAIWSPAFEQLATVVEDLSIQLPEPQVEVREDPGIRSVPGRVTVPAQAGTLMPDLPEVRLERLASGLTLAPGNADMIFVGGEFESVLDGGRLVKSGPNGALWVFDGPPSEAALDELGGVRPERILIFAPEPGLAAARTRFAGWEPGDGDTVPIPTIGQVATVDVPGLVVLKTWIETRLIEAGWWGSVALTIDGLEGSRLVISGPPEMEARVREWIGELAGSGIDPATFERVRDASAGYFDRIRTELQIILWQRAPGGAIPPPLSITLARLRDLAGSGVE